MTKEATTGRTTEGTMMVGQGTVVMTLITLTQDPTTLMGPQHQIRTPLLVSIYQSISTPIFNQMKSSPSLSQNSAERQRTSTPAGSRRPEPDPHPLPLRAWTWSLRRLLCTLFAAKKTSGSNLTPSSSSTTPTQRSTACCCAAWTGKASRRTRREPRRHYVVEAPHQIQLFVRRAARVHCPLLSETRSGRPKLRAGGPSSLSPSTTLEPSVQALAPG